MFGHVDPRREVVCCADPACGRELTRAERHAAHEQDGYCDECFVAAHEPTQVLSSAAAAQTIAERRALRDARERLPAPPRVPADMRETVRPPRAPRAA